MNKELLKKYAPCIIITLIILISYSIYQYRKSKKKKQAIKNQKFPPYISECPDGWKAIGFNKCKRIYAVGLPGCSPHGHSPMVNNVVDFNKNIYKGKNGKKNKCSWSVSCQAPWEGIDDLCV